MWNPVPWMPSIQTRQTQLTQLGVLRCDGLQRWRYNSDSLQWLQWHITAIGFCRCFISNFMQRFWQRTSRHSTGLPDPLPQCSTAPRKWRKQNKNKINNFTIGDILSKHKILASSPDATAAATYSSNHRAPRTLAFLIPFLQWPPIRAFSFDERY